MKEPAPPSSGELRQLARSGDLVFRTGPFLVRLQSRLDSFLDTWQRAYGSLEPLPADTVCHYRIAVTRGRGVAGLLRRQALFRADGMTPFDPYPFSHAFPMYEWGLNWCIAMSAHNYLLLHSAVVEKAGRALLLPARPGSGKSTLCAALVGRGWRLLSDEFGILRHEDGLLLPLPRAAPLKNESIDLLARVAPALTFGPRYDRTRKGDVVHLFPPADSLRRQEEPARPRWIIFPRYRQGARLELTPEAPLVTFNRLINNAFNYRVTGEAGFTSTCRLLRNVDSFRLEHGNVEEAVDSIEALLEDDLR
ncbi:MAG: HprK-related kinase A [Pseudohaliea sp.]